MIIAIFLFHNNHIPKYQYRPSPVTHNMCFSVMIPSLFDFLVTNYLRSAYLRRLGKDCNFKEENEIAVAVKYVKEQG